MKIDSELIRVVGKKIKKLIDAGSTKTYAVSSVCSEMGIDDDKLIMQIFFPSEKSEDGGYTDIKTSIGSYVMLKKNPNKIYEVININNKSAIVLRDIDDNSEVTANEDEITPVVMETMMKQNLKEANYNLSIDGLQTMDADTLSQILTLAGQAENGSTAEPMDMGMDSIGGEIDYVQSEFDSPETIPQEPSVGVEATDAAMDFEPTIPSTMDGPGFEAAEVDSIEEPMGDEVGVEATDAEITPTYDEFEDVGYEYDNMMTTESVDVKEDVLLDPESDDETYNAERKESHEKEELEEAYNGNYETLKNSVIRNEISTDEAISALLDMGEATDEEEALDIINGMKMESDVDELEEEGTELEGDFESYVIYEFDGDECLGSKNATTWDEAEKQAMEIHGAGHDAIVAGINTNGEEIDLGKKGEFLQDKESLNEEDMSEDDMGDIDMSDIEDIDISESEEIVDGEEIIEEENNFDDEIAECLRLAGVELNEVSDEKATNGKKDLPQVVGHKTAFSKAEKDGFKPGENQRPDYKCVKTKDVMGKKASEGTARPMNISEMVSKKKIESICETASRMYAKKDHKEWLALDRRYVEKLIKEGVSYSNASKMLLKAKKGN